MIENIEDLSIEKWEEGIEVVKVLEKKILSKGAWATIMYLYQEINKKTKEYNPPKAKIVRYRKLKGEYKPKSKINISNAKQAIEIAKVLQEWFKDIK